MALAATGPMTSATAPLNGALDDRGADSWQGRRATPTSRIGSTRLEDRAVELIDAGNDKVSAMLPGSGYPARSRQLWFAWGNWPAIGSRLDAR
jgi:hypothetical protein